MFAATHRRARLWVGLSTVKAIVANWLAPGRIDRFLASAGYSGQLADRLLPSNAPSNLFEPVAGDYGTHGRFDEQARAVSWQLFADRHRAAVALGAVTLVWMLSRRGSRRRPVRALPRR
ncbi:MAG TPA: hypothetical protein VGH40_14040 [Roseiarcus sp.]